MQVSVLMSVYAKEKPEYLDAALKSIMAQTLPPDEIVLIKDGPLTVGLDSVIDKYIVLTEQGPELKIVSLENNVGLGPALNAGVDVCSHELIARADSDDISLPRRIEQQVSYMERYPDTRIISSNIQEYNEDMTQKLAMRSVPEKDADIKKFARHRNPFNHMAVLYRKSAIQSVGSYEDCPYFEDYYLWCKVINQGGRFYNFQQPLVHARSGSSMIGRRGGLSYAVHIISFYRKAYRLNIMSSIDVFKNVLVRISVAIMPRWARGVVYRRALRAKF